MSSYNKSLKEKTVRTYLVMSRMSALVKEKRQALAHFVEGLQLKSEAIYRIYLFGSVRKGTPSPMSDIDLVIVYFGDKDAILADVSESMLQTAIETSHQIEPVLYSLPEFRRGQAHSFFLNQVQISADVIWVNDKIKQKEIQALRNLAEEFLMGAKENLREERLRIAIDAGYNAIELCVKALLLLKMDELPSSHGGILTKFGELYIKSNEIQRELGRRINQAIILRSKARYDTLAVFTLEDGEFIIQTADSLFQEVEKCC
ncbi:MAG: HEPN domain-containing protein [Candidatus Heimdallarchaeota archaeon]